MPCADMRDVLLPLVIFDDEQRDARVSLEKY